jgi:transposase
MSKRDCAHRRTSSTKNFSCAANRSGYCWRIRPTNVDTPRRRRRAAAGSSQKPFAARLRSDFANSIHFYLRAKAAASELKGSRWVLLKNAQDLTPHQVAKLAVVAKLNAPLYRAYLLKEQLRMVFHVGYDEAIRSLERWLRWARRCRIGPFVALARTIRYYRADIEATLLHGVNNGRVESLNTKVRLIARRASGSAPLTL